MPEKPLTIATYAAGASLAAITLVYVFGPTFFLDDDAANSSRSSRKRGVVGLVNPANDCFINSVLQALAGVPELRLYLIRELHQRRLDGPQPYNDLAAALDEQTKIKDTKKRAPEWKLLGLQQGLVTRGLKEVLDALNERPIYKKTISAQHFIRCVEEAFRTRISRQQQDAQEFLQVVTERLHEEWKAGRRVRKAAGRKPIRSFEHTLDIQGESVRGGPEDQSAETEAGAHEDAMSTEVEAEDSVRDSPSNPSTSSASSGEKQDAAADEPTAFPFEGKLESTVECMHCHFQPKPSVSTFTTLTLHVPHYQSSTTLNDCFDGMLKVENIDDFKCDKCRLVHAVEVYERQLSKTSLPAEERERLEDGKAQIERAIEQDPEKPPEGVKLPDLATVPKRKIQRHMRIARFPRILAIHLSRSMWDPHSVSTKNLAKVSFPEALPLGGLLDRKTYRLLCVVTHKGGHNSGHYESFRRQVLKEPFSTSATMGTGGPYSRLGTPVSSPRPSAAASPNLAASTSHGGVSFGKADSPTDTATSPGGLTPSSSSASSRSLRRPLSSLDRRRAPPQASVPLDAMPTPGLPTPPPERSAFISKAQGDDSAKRTSGVASAMNRVSTAASSVGSKRRQRKGDDRWWRISDESVKEAKTSDVLRMQREIYLLFYEMLE